MDRRAFLTAVAASIGGLGLAGCTSVLTDDADEANETQTTTQRDHERASDPWRTLGKTDGSTSASGVGTHEPEEYAVWGTQDEGGTETRLRVSVTVQGRNAVDVLAMSASSIDLYQKGEDSPYYDDLVEYGVTEVTLANEGPSGLHRFVFDNTAAVGSGPSGIVEFEASVSG